MNINFNSIIFKALFSIFISFTVIAIFIVTSAKETFQMGYVKVIDQKISIIEKSISPSLALNVSFGFLKSIDEIAKENLKNEDILLIKIKSELLKENMIYSDDNKTIKEFQASKEFVSTSELLDPTTNEVIGTLTLVFSNDSYDTYMRDFYAWLLTGISLLFLAMIFVSRYIYKALKNLTGLENELKNFNPSKPEYIYEADISAKDEVSSIRLSANIMIDNIIKYIDYSKKLNKEVHQQQKHLKDAQRIAHVGSWEYDIVNNELTLSDEIYRILGLKKDKEILWNQFLGFIHEKDNSYILDVLDKAITNGSTFDMKYTLSLPNGKEIDIHSRGKVRKKADGTSKITSVSRDITEDVKNKKIIERLAYYDALTGLPNRSLLKDRTHKALQAAQRMKERVAIIFLDLDHFKLINDTLGHNTGDELLVYVSKILKEQIRESDTISRIGGDEFVILLPRIQNIHDVEFIANKLLEVLRGKHDINSKQLYITTSIGISIYPDNSGNMDELITNADTAMYDAKQDGRNNYKLYSSSMGNHISQQMSIEQDLRVAVKNGNQLEMYYQPKIDSKENFIAGAEALIRWNHPEKGLMFPDEFIGVAESTGMILEIGNWVISQAIYQIQEWNKLGLLGLKIAINLSPRQFQDKDLVPHVSQMLQKHQIDPSQLEFEITETMSMTNIESTMRILYELKELGVSIAIDDFGTGYSSLSYLKKFPVHILKIDKSFVMDMTDNSEDKTIVETIITMAHTLGFKTVAEGVETQKHTEMLKDMGCDQLQGYHFSRPVPKDEFFKFLKDYSSN